MKCLKKECGRKMENIELSVIENINALYDELFTAEKRVADYILENMNEVIMLNVSELAHKSGASEATVVRMCKHLGYDGYYQMRLIISRDSGIYKKAQSSNHMFSSSKQIFSNNSERINNLADYISIETLINAGSLLRNANVIHIASVGNTVPIVMDLGFRLERNGLKCTYSLLPEHFFNHISLGDQNDLVVGITRSGSSKQVIRAIELAHKKGMKTLVITGELNKQLVDHADCVIRIVEKEHTDFSVYRPDSHLLEMAVNDALLYVVKNYHTITNDLNSSDEGTNDVDLLLSEFKI